MVADLLHGALDCNQLTSDRKLQKNWTLNGCGHKTPLGAKHLLTNCRCLCHSQCDSMDIELLKEALA